MRALRLIPTLIILSSVIVRGQDTDLDDPKTLEGIIANSVPLRTMHPKPGPNGELLICRGPQGIPYTGWVKAMYDNGQVSVLEHAREGKKDGPYIMWHLNGVKKQEGACKDGLVEGLVITWHKNGEKGEEGTVKAGKKDGLYTWWDESGKKSGETTYKDGKRSGKSTSWYENGQKKP